MTRVRLNRILVLALPVMGGMLAQNLMTLVDTLMVGSLGNAALAAVGMGGFIVFMCQAMTLGLASGVQAIAARRKGQGRTAELAFALNAGLFAMLMLGPLWSALLFFATPELVPLLNDDPAVVAQLVPYVQWRVLAITFVGINFAFRGYWAAVDSASVYLRTLLLMLGLNMAFNYVLIFGELGFPTLGVEGAGIGTAVATVCGTLVYFAAALGSARDNGFLRGLLPRSEMLSLLRLSAPYGLQQFFLAAGFTALYWIVGHIGTHELAAATVLINITLVAILPGIGLGIAAATLVGQALGRGEPRDAARWTWQVVAVGVVGMSLLGVPMWLMPDALLSAFIQDPDTLQLARLPMQIVGATLAIEAVGLVLMHALHGAGDATRAMLVAVSFQWLGFLPLAYWLGPGLGMGLLAIWLAHIGYRACAAMAFFALWRHGRWATSVI